MMISWHFLFNSGVKISAGANTVPSQMPERRVRWGHLPHKEIAIVLIGPHTKTMAEQKFDTKAANAVVPPDRKMTLQGVAGCFHELSSGVLLALPKPDAVFALNSGLIFYPTWADTVDRVLVRTTPACLCVVGVKTGTR